MLTAQLLVYAATEVSGTFQRVIGALKHFTETGEFPCC